MPVGSPTSSIKQRENNFRPHPPLCRVHVIRVLDHVELLVPGSLATSSSIAGAAFIEHLTVEPVSAAISTALAQAANAGSASETELGNGTASVSHLEGDGSTPSTPGPALAQWARAFEARRRLEEAGGRPDARLRLSSELSAAAYPGARAELMLAAAAALPSRLAGGGSGAAALPQAVAVAMTSSEAPSFAFNLLKMAELVGQAAPSALRALPPPPPPPSVENVAGGESALVADALVTAEEDGAEAVAQRENEMSSRLLQEEGAPSWLLGGLVLSALELASTHLDAAAAADPAGLSAAVGAVAGGKLLWTALEAALRGFSGRQQRSGRVDDAGSVAAAVGRCLAILSREGCFVGCCNAVCANLDKMSESGLDVRLREANHDGVYCCEGCAAAAAL